MKKIYKKLTLFIMMILVVLIIARLLIISDSYFCKANIFSGSNLHYNLSVKIVNSVIEYSNKYPKEAKSKHEFLNFFIGKYTLQNEYFVTTEIIDNVTYYKVIKNVNFDEKFNYIPPYEYIIDSSFNIILRKIQPYPIF